MKKTLMVTSIFIAILSIVAFMFLDNSNKQQEELKKVNMLYERYQGKNILGTDVATIINMATHNNEQYQIKKDEKGNYIEDEKYCIKVEVTIQENTYQMERINNLGTSRFVQNFNVIDFYIEKIEYNKDTGRIKKINIKQVQ